MQRKPKQDSVHMHSVQWTEKAIANVKTEHTQSDAFNFLIYENRMKPKYDDADGAAVRRKREILK